MQHDDHAGMSICVLDITQYSQSHNQSDVSPGSSMSGRFAYNQTPTKKVYPQAV